MRLFNIGEDYTVELNKEWMLLIPAFAALLKRDKGSKKTKPGEEGDYRGDKKLKARKELAFIYFDLDFTSPLREWDAAGRRDQAMIWAGLTESDLDDEVMTAHKEYNNMLQKSSRSLRTLRSLERGLDALDTHYETLDFNLKDSRGMPINDPNAFLNGIEKINKSYAALDMFKKRIEEELKGDQGIRGSAKLGMNEGTKRTKVWNESGASQPAADDSAQDDNVEQTNFADIAKLLRRVDVGEPVVDLNEQEEPYGIS